MSILFHSISNATPVQDVNFVDIDGLKIDLPAATSRRKTALIILNVPQPYARKGREDFPGIIFQLQQDDQPTGAKGGFTYSDPDPASPGRQPFTLVTMVTLNNGKTSEIQAQWQSVRDSTGVIDSFASITAIIA